jgi:hypothetical protein
MEEMKRIGGTVLGIVLLASVCFVRFLYAVEDPEELLGILKAKDAQFDNAALRYTTWGEFTQEGFPAWKYPEIAKQIGIPKGTMYGPSKQIKFRYNEELVVRGPNTAFTRVLDQTLKLDENNEGLQRFQKWSNTDGLAREILDGDETHKGDRIIQVHSSGAPVDLAQEQRMWVEFAHGVGFGKRIREIESLSAQNGKTIIKGTIQMWWEDTSQFAIAVDDNYIVRRAVIDSNVHGNLTRFEVTTQGTVERKGFVVAETGHFVRRWMGMYRDGKKVGRPKVKKEFYCRFKDIVPNLSDEQYESLTKMEATPGTYVMDHVANLNYTVGQSHKGALDSIELKSKPDSIEKGEHSNRRPSATDANIPIELVDITVKDEVINPLMDVFKEVHPNQPEQDYDFAQKCLRDAINKARVKPTSEQIEEICREIKRIGQVWKKHGKVVRSPDFSCTVQLLVYWYLTPPRFSKADAVLVKNQHKELVDIVAKLPKRLIEEFNAPKELEKEIEQLFGIGLNDFKTFIESPFLRFSQVPVVSARFEELKRTMENHILQGGEQLSRQLEENIKDWRRDVNMQRNLRSWHRETGRDLLADQYTSCKHFATFMCGGAMSDFEMSIMRILYRKSKTELFPFYRVDTYGTKYEVGIGWLFRIRPKITLSPKSGPNTLSSSQKMISEEEGQRQSSEQTAP